MVKPYTPILLGTAHTHSLSAHVAKFVKKVVTDFGFQTNILDPKDHLKSFATDNDHPSPTWKNTVIKANALIIVSP